VAQLADIYSRYAINPDESGRLNFITDILDAGTIPYPDDDAQMQAGLPKLT